MSRRNPPPYPPRYVAMGDTTTCGHQHRTPAAALHCGGNVYRIVWSAKDKYGNRQVSFEKVAG